MTRSLALPGLGLIAGLALMVAPSIGKAQYRSPAPVGVTIATPSFGFSLGVGQQVYRPAVVPVAPVYGPFVPSYYPPRPIPYGPPAWNPYRPYPGYGYGPGHNHGPYRGGYGRPF